MAQLGALGLTNVGVAGAPRRFRGWCLPMIISLEMEIEALELLESLPSLSTQLRNRAGDGDYGAGTSKASEKRRERSRTGSCFVLNPTKMEHSSRISVRPIDVRPQNASQELISQQAKLGLIWRVHILKTCSLLHSPSDGPSSQDDDAYINLNADPWIVPSMGLLAGVRLRLYQYRVFSFHARADLCLRAFFNEHVFKM